MAQDHSQGPCATWDICQKRSLNSNYANLVCPYIAYFIYLRLNRFEMLYIAQRWYWHGLCKISKTCVNWKGCYWLARFCEIWHWDAFRTDIRLYWTVPLEPDFFNYTVSRVSNLVWLRFVLMECFSYHHCSQIWRYTDTPMVNITYINITYINDCTVTYIHALHTPMGSRCIPRTAPSVNERYLPKHSWEFLPLKV